MPPSFESMRFVQPMLRVLIYVPVMCSRSTSFLLLGNEGNVQPRRPLREAGRPRIVAEEHRPALERQAEEHHREHGADTRGHVQHMWVSCCPSLK